MWFRAGERISHRGAEGNDGRKKALISAHVRRHADSNLTGPYWARHAALVPVGGEHLVVFGGDEPLPDPDAVLVPAAAHLVAAVQNVSAAKLSPMSSRW